MDMANNSETQMGICIHSGHCGGCAYQGVDYGKQLQIKNDEVETLLKSKSINYAEYLGIEGSPSLYRYRNKMEYTFGDMVKAGEMTLGMHQKKRFMSVVTVDCCQIVDEDFNAVLSATLEFCKEKGYSHYSKKSHKGLLRHLVIRRGVATKELLVNIVTSSQGCINGDEFVALLFGLNLNNRIVGIVNTVYDGLADFIYCDKLNVLSGRSHYMERVMDLDFKVGAFSFFQTNVLAAERLYAEAIAMIDEIEGKEALDLFCGTGTITQALAKKAKRAIGIELSHEAVVSARENAKMNGASNCEFIEGDVLAAMGELSAAPDAIILDPPRAGVQPKALDKIVKYGAKQIVYISCNPKTFAENLYYLQYFGYKSEKIKAYDNFPFTKHCECVASMKKS